MGLVVAAFAFVLLVAMWIVGDLEFRTKVILTIVYAVSWGLVFMEVDWLPLLIQGTLAVVLWFVTFGPSGGR